MLKHDEGVTHIRQLMNLGPKSEKVLHDINIKSVDAFLSADVFDAYKRLYEKSASGVSLNMLYAMIGAQENEHWQRIKAERKTEILLHLDDLGIAR
ncbi:TfoX/Sxy family DNA transformation protein [Marinomonas balearica]|uniref:DNA transformation protein n=1 Tax=Marinomonas balearica TaxID=491947 RepID=A0A4R6MH10_9GAMM|nr:TfoX/Sxy family DNA transformation protein [Marinomonas balearica]TDP01219.1 DNA transformation protein [Marinomonas balearica]